MGYISYVSGNVTVDEKKLEQIEKDIQHHKKLADSGNCQYINWHIGECTLDYNELTFYDDGSKWYAFDEFIKWLNQYAIEGEIIREGEESGDKEGYRWNRDGTKEKLVVREEWIVNEE